MNGAAVTLNASNVSYTVWVHYALQLDFVNMQVTLYINGTVATDATGLTVTAPI